MAERKLGRGLGSIASRGLREEGGGAADYSALRAEVPVADVTPNPLQPRHTFVDAAMAGLVESIRQNGIIQPILVKPVPGGYQLIAGERRWRAAKAVGLATIPAIVRETASGEAGDRQMLELALVENIQREDLNPIEKGEGLKAYIERFSVTQEDAAKRLGQDRSTIANLIRLLELPEDVKELVRQGDIMMGHARALLRLTSPSGQITLANRVKAEGLSVRQVERIVALGSRPRATAPVMREKPAHIRQIEDELMERLGTRVHVEERKEKGTGRIIIDFYSYKDFDRILDCIH